MSIAGTRIAGQYTLLRPLGHGASSTVYLALGDDGLPYTVKLFPSTLASHALRESQMRIRAPQLAEVVALSELNGQPAVVLHYTRGVEMFRRYRLRPALLHEPAAYLKSLGDILLALHAMHQGGLLHRDVKADNVLVQPGGEARLLDYDLSGPISETFPAPLRIGTAAFQSPEATRGDALGPQTDLFGVGILLFWGLRGALPEENAHDPGHGALADLCRRLLDPDPCSRPNDARQVFEALHGAAQGHSAPSHSAPEKEFKAAELHQPLTERLSG